MSFRSEEMSLCLIYIKRDESAYGCVCEMGELGLIHFNNLNEDENVLQLKFIQDINQCGEMQRIIDFLRSEIEAAGIEIPILHEENYPPAPPRRELIELRLLLQNMDSEALNIIRNYEMLKSKYFDWLETSAVLEKADEFFSDSSILAWSDSVTRTLLQDTNDFRGVQVRKDEGLKLGYLTGTIPIENYFAFERVLWRVCRGNFFIRHSHFREVYHESSDRKFVFIIFFQGDVIEKNIRRICQGFRTVLYQCPESSRERIKHMDQMDSKIKDIQIVLEQSDYHRRRVLGAAAVDLPLWRIKVKKAMAVFHVMNQMTMDAREKYLTAECWIPSSDITRVQQALYRNAVRSSATVPPILTEVKKTSKIPPTYNKTNRLIYGFQLLIDAYGVGDYRELNPAPYTIISFPFLFAVMFGDLGHGLLLSIFSGWLVYKEKFLLDKDIRNEIWSFIFGGRYILLCMGLFSMYTGFIYNDMFSKSLSIFGSAWRVKLNQTTILSNPNVQLNPRTAYRHHPYYFGIDPIYNASGENAIIFLNSFKMKVAIILGVVHMFFGLVLGAYNHIFFGSMINLFGMCIPQMIFFGLFVYLAMLIILKWILFSGDNDPPYSSNCAPSILIMFIDMVLFKGAPDPPDGCSQYMFVGQQELQNVLMILALLMIPIMLFAKPVYIMCTRKSKKKGRKRPRKKVEKKVKFNNVNGTDDGLTVRIVSQQADMDDRSSSSSYSLQICQDELEEADKPVDLAEAFIEQGIQAIESVLGSVSHTASYLRLWALSLAHNQLSEVLWSMVLRRGLMIEDWLGSIFLAFTFLAWSLLTVSILVVMEGLSAFLHTLRLHWVEFQSKFYVGTGIAYQPFDFKAILALDNEMD